ncbi:hypothetical protein Ancab_012406 [Ancistrocladus abbreviatus]
MCCIVLLNKSNVVPRPVSYSHHKSVLETQDGTDSRDLCFLAAIDELMKALNPISRMRMGNWKVLSYAVSRSILGDRSWLWYRRKEIWLKGGPCNAHSIGKEPCELPQRFATATLLLRPTSPTHDLVTTGSLTLDNLIDEVELASHTNVLAKGDAANVKLR